MYVGPVIHSISHPQTTLGTTMNWLAPWTDGKYIENFFKLYSCV